MYGFKFFASCLIISCFSFFFFFSEKLRDELKENPEESKTHGTKKSSSRASNVYRSSTLPRSYGVSLDK